MKKSFNLLPVVGGALAMLMSVSSCSDKMDEEVISNNPSDQVPAEVVSKLDRFGFNTDGIKMDGQNYLVEGDMVMTPEALAELGEGISVPGIAGEEQYRTSNLVNCNGSRTIRVRSYITSGARSQGVDYAIANWNALNTCFTFQRVFSGSADINIYSTSGSGGSAGFPSGGNPYGTVYIGSGITNNQVAEHVTTHEMGHCFGMRHTDYMNRSYSCGSGGNEGSAGVGAIHIPGTPTGIDGSSIMLSCYSSNTNGEFGSYDRAALESLY
ncbi:M57 family metalloprotease [Roseivirga sp. BDSF3-8]|uniref:M57 family metalloprotease n=1 Tax=Roseivirga sp. BDSF3-8 TaxID=3241598 RepID=UPI003531EC74